jgi:oligopeptide/dipeptide ABC transporter ATP-binding protein
MTRQKHILPAATDGLVPPEPWSSPAVQPPGPPLLSVRGLCKHFPIYSKGLFKKQTGVVKACDNVSFDLHQGETLGLVGESGCGKTTTGRAILRALMPTAGEILFQTADGSVNLANLPEQALIPLRPQMQMIFQDPFSSLNPRMTVRGIVGEPLVIHGMARGSELDDRVADMLHKVGLKPHEFSGGQRQRIGIARALIMRPRLVVCDEAVSALDVSVQAQVINLLQDLQQELGLTYIFIAHDLSVVKHICNRIAVMYAGRIVELAATDALFKAPRHPYTRLLLSAVPNPDPDRAMSMPPPGEVADPGNLPTGCAFSPRCPACSDKCRHTIPMLEATPDGRLTACHHPEV